MLELHEEVWPVAKLVMERMVRRYHRAYGGDRDEYESVVSEAYVHALRTFKRDKASFKTWLYRQIRLMFWDKFLHRRRRGRRIELHLEALASQQRFDYRLFRAELSRDARKAVGLVVKQPFKLMYHLTGPRQSGRDLRRALERLLLEMGWTRDRIDRTFTEVQEAL